MVTDFILVRHGETDYNELSVLQGWIDTALNEIGREQAELTAEILREEEFDEVWHSDLQRARCTAAAILKYHPDVPVYPCMKLREWKLGILQNYSHAELEKEYPEYEEMLRNEEIELSIPGGESRGEFQRRINEAFQELADRSPGKRLLIVSHGGVLVRLFHFLGEKVPEDRKKFFPGNASVSRVRYDHAAKKWSLIVWNQTCPPRSGKMSDTPAL